MNLWMCTSYGLTSLWTITASCTCNTLYNWTLLYTVAHKHSLNGLLHSTSSWLGLVPIKKLLALLKSVFICWMLTRHSALLSLSVLTLFVGQQKGTWPVKTLLPQSPEPSFRYVHDVVGINSRHVNQYNENHVIQRRSVGWYVNISH